VSLAIDLEQFDLDLSMADDLVIIENNVEVPGKPLDDLIDELTDRAAQDWDNLIVVIGERGAGKSTTALEVAKRVDSSFNLTRIAYMPHEILDIAAAAPDGSAILIDEVGEAWGSADFASQINRTLRKAFIGNRYRNMTFIFCCPTFADASSGLRNMARYLIDVKSRKVAVVYDLKRDHFLPKKYPFRYTKFLWARKPLPKHIYAAYARVKTERGTERLKKYRDQLEDAGGGVSYDVVLEEVLTDWEVYINSQGWVSEDMVYSKFKDRGLQKKEARAIKVEGSRKTRVWWAKREEAKNRKG